MPPGVGLTDDQRRRLERSRNAGAAQRGEAEALSSQLEALKMSMREKDDELEQAQDDVRRAAEFGSMLVQQVQAQKAELSAAHDRTEAAEEEREELRQSAHKLRQENEQMRRQLSMVEEDSAVDQQAMDSIRAQAHDAADKQRQRSVELEQLRDSLSTAERALGESQGACERLILAKTELEGRLAEYVSPEVHAVVAGQVSDLTVELADARAQAEDSARAQQEQYAELRAENEALQASSKKLRTTLVDRFAQSKAKYEEQVAQLLHRQEILTEECQRLQEAAAEGGEEGGGQALSLEMELGGLSKQEHELAEMQQRLEATAEEAAAARKAHTAAAEEAQRQIVALQDRAAAAETLHTSQAATLAGLQAQMEGERRAGEAVGQQVAALTAERRTLQQQVENVRQELLAAQDQQARLAEQLAQGQVLLEEQQSKVR